MTELLKAKAALLTAFFSLHTYNSPVKRSLLYSYYLAVLIGVALLTVLAVRYATQPQTGRLPFNSATATQSSPALQDTAATGSSLLQTDNTTIPNSNDSSSIQVQNDGNTSTNVTINGEEQQLPENGSMHKETSGNSSKTSVDITIDNSSTGVTSNSSTSVQMHTRSTDREGNIMR